MSGHLSPGTHLISLYQRLMPSSLCRATCRCIRSFSSRRRFVRLLGFSASGSSGSTFFCGQDRERPSRATLLGGTHEGSPKLRVGSSPKARIWAGSRDHHRHSAGPSLNTQRVRCGVQYGPQTRRKCRRGRSGWCTGLESGVADAGRGGTDVSARDLPRRLVRQKWDTCQTHLVL